MYVFALDTIQDGHTIVVNHRIRRVYRWRGNFHNYFSDSNATATIIIFVYNNKGPGVYNDQSVQITTMIAMAI